MSKIKFGNFITYNGKFLSTAIQKAQSGNLVFARITNSPKADNEFKASVEVNATPEAPIWFKGVEQTANFSVNNVNKDGYYIFGGKADGHLVTYEVFKTLKEEVAALDAKVGDLSIGEGESKVTYKDVPAYVDAKLANIGGASALGVTLEVRDSEKATDDVLPTEKAVRTAIDTAVNTIEGKIEALPTYGVSGSTNISVTPTIENGKHNFTVNITDNVATKDYVNAQVSKIDGIMEFKGLYEGEQLPTVTAESTDYNPGDVIVWKNKEYVLDKSNAWVEIGQVHPDEAVTTLGGTNGDITLGTGLSMVGKQLTVTFPVVDVQGEQKTTTVIGKAAIGVTGVVAGNNTEYEVSLRLGTSGNVTLQQDSTHGLTAHVDAEDLVYVYTKAGATVENVKDALNELYDDKEVVAQALVDLKSGISGLDTRLDTIEADYVKSVSLSDAAADSPYISIAPTKGDVKIGLNVVTTNEAILSDQADDALVSAAGLREYSKAENISYAGATGVAPTTVETALDNLFEQVTALNNDVKDASEITYTAGTGITTGEGVDKVNEALDDLYSQIATLGGAAVTDVKGDADSYSEVASSKDDEHIKIVKNVLADNVVGEDGTTKRLHGLVTDEYLDDALAWEDITD